DELRTELGFVFGAGVLFEVRRLGDDWKCVLSKPDDDLLDVVGHELSVQVQRGFQAAVNEVTHGVGLDRGLQQAPVSTQLGGHFSPTCTPTGEVRVDQPDLAFIGSRRRYETAAGHMSCSNAGQSPPARMQALGPGAFLEKYLHA